MSAAFPAYKHVVDRERIVTEARQISKDSLIRFPTLRRGGPILVRYAQEPISRAHSNPHGLFAPGREEGALGPREPSVARMLLEVRRSTDTAAAVR